MIYPLNYSLDPLQWDPLFFYRNVELIKRGTRLLAVLIEILILAEANFITHEDA